MPLGVQTGGTLPEWATTREPLDLVTSLPAPPLPKASLVISAMPASEPMTVDASSGNIKIF
jgi:hypothetical protein